MAEAGSADIVGDLAFPLPALTGFRILGLPPEDLEMLKSRCGDRVEFTYGRAPAAEHSRVARNVADFWVWMGEFVAERIKNPVDDLTSDLVRRHLAEPGEFTPLDIRTVLFEMALASHETTTNLVSNGLRRLLEHRRQWEAIIDDPSLIPNAIEECLRFEGSVIAWRRRATQESELGGVTIPEGSTVLVLIGSANRDPRRFSDPETFDIRRRDAREHLTFGKGIHFCQGAPLARLESRIVFELFATLTPTMRVVPDQETEFAPYIMLRGPKRLLVEFP